MSDVLVIGGAGFAVAGVGLALVSVPATRGVAAGVSLALMSLFVLALWFRFGGPTLSRNGWVLCPSCRRLEVGGQHAPELAEPRRRGEFWFPRLFLWLYAPALFYLAWWVLAEGGSLRGSSAPGTRVPVTEFCMITLATLAGAAGRAFVPAVDRRGTDGV